MLIGGDDFKAIGVLYGAVISSAYLLATKYPRAYLRIARFIIEEKFNTMMLIIGVPAIAYLIIYYITGRQDARDAANGIFELYGHVLISAMIFGIMGIIFKDEIEDFYNKEDRENDKNKNKDDK